jgi:hypothetical protein
MQFKQNFSLWRWYNSVESAQPWSTQRRCTNQSKSKIADLSILSGASVEYYSSAFKLAIHPRVKLKRKFYFFVTVHDSNIPRTKYSVTIRRICFYGVVNSYSFFTHKVSSYAQDSNDKVCLACEDRLRSVSIIKRCLMTTGVIIIQYAVVFWRCWQPRWSL